MATATQNIYRYTDAIDLATYIDLQDATDMAQVQYLFTESDAATPGVIRGATETHIVVNQSLSGVDAVPDYATVAADGEPVDDADPLDFQNDAANPTQTYLAAPAITLPDTAIITMFVASVESGVTPQEVSSTSFEVVTTNEAEYTSDGIFTSGAEAIACITTFDNWSNTGLNTVLNCFNTPPTALTTTVAPVFTPTPVNITTDPGIPGGYTGAPAGSASLSIATALNAGNSGIAGFDPQLAYWQSHLNDLATLNDRIPVSAGDLIVLRYSVATDALPAEVADQAQVRYRAGRPSTTETGVAVDEVIGGSPDQATNAGQVHNVYYYGHAAEDIIVCMDVYDDVVGRNINITLNQVDAYRVPRASLTGGTVLFNQGAAAVTVSAGEEAPPATDRADFSLTNWTQVTGNTSTGRTFSSTGSGANALITTSSQTASQGLVHHSWETADANRIMDVPNDALVCLDVWMSSPAQGGLATNALPVNRIQLSNLISDGQGRDAYFEWSGAKDATDTDVLALDATSRRYSVFMQPQMATAATMNLRVLILAEFYDIITNDGGVTWVNPNNGTVQIDRVVVTQYDVPGVGASLCD
jgi:hypothetical protein